MSQEFLARILEQKAREVEQMELEEIQPLRQTYRLADYLKQHQDRLQVIAEVKKASPSLGDINLDVDIVQQAQTYEANGAVMISVLTDEVFFKGHLDYLREISSQVNIPTLNKDFIIDEKQIIRARNVAELEVAHRLGAQIIGVNNRNLTTFEVDLQTSVDLAKHFKDDCLYISESAIFTGQDAERVAPYFNGILVGTALMQAEDVAQSIKELQIDKG